tara:strand:- start:158 stop:361 length:204 start_codon:yes stop_codon:yes gene_type:complete
LATRDKKRLSTYSEIARYYLDMILIYEKVGIGNLTKEGTKVTKSLIDNCKERFLYHALKAHRRELDE